MRGQWGFTSRYGCENGLDTSDMETFKKDPYASLAREITQNSIDAALGEEPVRIEFKLFDLPKDSIPGQGDLAEEIDKTWKFVADSNKDKKPLEIIKKYINARSVKCLRISDFNTKGLVGASTNERDTPFYNLTKGSGVSDKTGTAGGSKGIGKFATFVASTTNTVFYSTVTIENETGNIGICKLRSRQVDDDRDLLTEGTGYYAIGERHSPIAGTLQLDPTFQRTDQQTGTDVFVIGFKDHKGWKEEITAKILESFMVAILNEELEVYVDDIILSKATAKDVIFDSGLINKVGKKLKKDIEAQYELLTQNKEEGVFSRNISIDDNNKVTVYVKQYSSRTAERATKHCVMVRHPYMKITQTKGHSFLPYSALCIIHKNELNKKLRAIENPQHTDWEIKRLDEDPFEKQKTKDLKKSMENAIDSFIEEVLQQNSSESTDLEGAGEFLPAQEEAEGEDEGALLLETNEEEIVVSPIKRVRSTTPPVEKISKVSDSYEFGEGGEGEEGEGRQPKENETPPNPNPNPDHEPRDDDQVGTEGDSSLLVKVQLGGMKYHIIVTDKINGKYNIVFTSAYNEEKCELALKQFGADADKYPIDIVSATINGEQCMIEDGKLVDFKLKAEEQYTIECNVAMNTMFAGEVILYAYR